MGGKAVGTLFKTAWFCFLFAGLCLERFSDLPAESE